MRSGPRLVDAEDAPGARLGAPDFAGTSVQLTDIGARLVGREGEEGLAPRIEAQDRVGGEVGEPYRVGLVDVDGIGAWPAAGQLPALPAAVPRIVHAQVAAVPFADPEAPLAVGPDAARALLRRRRLDDARLARRGVDLGEVVAGERHVPDGAARCARDAVRSVPARCIPCFHLLALVPTLGLEAADHAALAREPERALLVEHGGIQIGVGLGHHEELHLARAAAAGRHVSPDRVLAALVDPGSPIGSDDDAVRRGARTEIDVADPGVAGIEQDQSAVALAGRPDEGTGVAGHVVQTRLHADVEGADAIAVHLARRHFGARR